ncbi:MAG: hypothetical protein Q8R13_04300 [bacterium]|nr:hypothetical protein [bacterium]MDZ4296049.1 hypothetical protein [Patescibacteria group bacterium]
MVPLRRRNRAPVVLVQFKKSKGAVLSDPLPSLVYPLARFAERELSHPERNIESRERIKITANPAITLEDSQRQVQRFGGLEGDASLFGPCSHEFAYSCKRLFSLAERQAQAPCFRSRRKAVKPDKACIEGCDKVEGSESGLEGSELPVDGAEASKRKMPLRWTDDVDTAMPKYLLHRRDTEDYSAQAVAYIRWNGHYQRVLHEGSW